MEKILIATVLKPQGLIGELKCKLENQNFEVIKSITEVFFNDKEIPTKIANMSYRAGYLFLRFNTINSREKAELLRNSKIYVRREMLKIPENEYMITDLIGMLVYDENGQKIGQILNVENYGATDILVIEQYKREYMIPFISDIVKNVNLSSKIVTINKIKYDEVKICD